MTGKMKEITIGALAQTCKVPTPTIRYYEKIALLPKAERSRADQRRYTRVDVERLDFIRRCRTFGFSIQQIRSLLAVPTGSAADCQTSKEIAQERIDEIRAKVADLLLLEKDLKPVIDECETTCNGQGNRTCGAFVGMHPQDPPA